MELRLELWDDAPDVPMAEGPTASLTLQLKKLSWTTALLLLSQCFSEFAVANEQASPADAPAEKEGASDQAEEESEHDYGDGGASLYEGTFSVSAPPAPSIFDDTAKLVDKLKELQIKFPILSAPEQLAKDLLVPQMFISKELLAPTQPSYGLTIAPKEVGSEENELPPLFLYRVRGLASLYSTPMSVTNQVELVDCVQAQLGCTKSVAWARVKMKEPLSGLLTKNEASKYRMDLRALGFQVGVEPVTLATDATFSLTALPHPDKWDLLSEKDVADLITCAGCKGALENDLRELLHAARTKKAKVGIAGTPRTEIAKILMLRYLLNQRGCRTLLDTE